MLKYASPFLDSPGLSQGIFNFVNVFSLYNVYYQLFIIISVYFTKMDRLHVNNNYTADTLEKQEQTTPRISRYKETIKLGCKLMRQKLCYLG